jgi:hypothetical protein
LYSAAAYDPRDDNHTKKEGARSCSHGDPNFGTPRERMFRRSAVRRLAVIAAADKTEAVDVL